MRPERRRCGVLRAIRVLKILSRMEDRDYIKDFKDGVRWTKTYVSTRKRCSCSGCGNPRHVPYGNSKDKITIKERKAKISEKEQIDNLEELDTQ